MKRGREALRETRRAWPRGMERSRQAEELPGNLPLEEDIRFQSVRTAPNLRPGGDPEAARWISRDGSRVQFGSYSGVPCYYFLAGSLGTSSRESRWQVCEVEKTWRVIDME